MQEIKKELYKHCLSYIQERIRTIEKAMILAREASEDDTKSSAGDKYETTREMMQQDISRNHIQLQEAMKLKSIMLQINPDKNYDIVQPGCLVDTNGGSFYISIPAGQVTINGKIFFAMSPGSPLGKAFSGLSAGSRVKFNHREFEIKKVL